MILCIGTTPTVQRTLVFDRMRIDDVNRAATTDEYASGKSVNVARVAALLGADVTATGFAGGDRGRFLKAQLSADGVRHSFQTVDAQTRLCTTVIDRAGGTVTELVEEHAAIDPADWADLFRRCVRLIAKGTSVVVLSGSLPPGGDQAFYPDVIEFAVHKGAKVIVDTRGEPLRRSLACGAPFVAKLNRAELAETVGRPLKSDKALKEAMRETTPAGGSIVVTTGKDGAAAWDGERFWRISAPPLAAVNPIGSGDAFAAGLAVAIEQGRDVEATYALAAACGGANAMTPRAGMVRPDDVKSLRKKVRVES